MEKRQADWEDFLKEQARLKEAVDEEHVKAVGRLSTQYSEMKKDLDKFSHFWCPQWISLFLYTDVILL